MNNNISNLRNVTRSQNMRNRKKVKNCLSKYIGVSYNKDVKRWISYIVINSKQIHLGYYESEILARKAYEREIIKNNLIDFIPTNKK